MPARGKTQAQKERPSACDPEGFERYRGPLRAYAYARVGDWEAAEDLAQETVIRALQSPHTPDDPHEIPTICAASSRISASISPVTATPRFHFN